MKKTSLFFLMLVMSLVWISSCSKDKPASPEPPKPDLPEITSISPETGDTGTVVTITGKYFGTDLSKVSISFGDAAGVPESLSDTKIILKAPDHRPGKVAVVVKVNNLASKEFDFTYNKPIKEDGFKEDAAGWKITGDAQGGYVIASYSPDGGVADGYIYAKDDVLGGVWYFTAPSSYLGDKSDYYNATLRFSLFQISAMTSQFASSDIIFENGSKKISCQLPAYPASTWTAYSFKINATGGWVNGLHPETGPASEADIKAVLSNVTGFHIRGEFETGPDRGGMDNIQIIKTGD